MAGLDRARWWWLGFIALGLFLIATASAWPHSWYEWHCCSDQDCAPVRDDEIQEGRSGYTVPSGELIQFGDERIKVSHDTRFHWCKTQQGTLCLYVPARGF